MSDTRDVVLQAVLDKLWSSHIEHTDAPGARNEYGNPSAATREGWQRYAEPILLRWLEYHSPSARDRAVEYNRGRRKPIESLSPEHCPYCGELRDQIPCQTCGGPR